MSLRGRIGRVSSVCLGNALAACTAATPAGTAPTATLTPVSSSAPSQSGPPIQDIMAIPPLSPDLEPGTYFIDPDGDASTPLRVTYEIAADGWSQWIGAFKPSDVGHTGLSITTVTNLVTHGCDDHSWADPPIGPSVDDLATALSQLG